MVIPIKNKERNMKRTITALLLALVVACGAMALTACGSKNEYSETFVGAVSKASYSTKDDAAEAFIENEVSGLAYDANYVGYEITEELTETQIDKLAIDEQLREDVVSVEKVKVSYTKNNIARTASAVAAGSDENVTVLYIYLITVTPTGTTITEYRYYVPLSKNGDTLTKSYFDDVFDPSKYINCTQSYSLSAFGIKTGGYVIKVADDKGSIKLDSAYAATADFSEGYFEQNGSTFRTYLKMNYSDTWQNGILQVMSLGGTSTITSMDQFATMCMPNNLDYSWFEKTDFGFKMKSELLSIYIADVLRQNGYSDADNISTDFSVYVKEGRIYKITTTITVKVFVTKINLQSENLEFGNFGATTVETPEDLA